MNQKQYIYNFVKCQVNTNEMYFYISISILSSIKSYQINSNQHFHLQIPLQQMNSSNNTIQSSKTQSINKAIKIFEYDCIHCFQIADDAVITYCCIKPLCEKHYKYLKTSICPSCQTPSFDVYIEPFSRKLIKNLSPEVKIFVNVFDNDVTVEMTLKTLDKVSIIRQKIHEKLKIPLQMMNNNLIFHGRAIKQQYSLKECKIIENSIIKIIEKSIKPLETSKSNRIQQQEVDYQCLICLQLAENVVVTNCCAKVMCFQHYLLVNAKPCPYCRKNPFQVHEEKFIQRQIYGMAPNIQLIINDLNRKLYCVMMKSLDKVSLLKEKIAEKTKIPVKKFYLIYNANLLNNQLSLRENKVVNDSNIHVKLRFRDA